MLLTLLLVLPISLVACSPGSSTTQPSAVTATPTVPATPAGTVLYQSDWSHGFADWKPTGHWTTGKGYLQSDSQGESTLTVPYKPTVTNYEVDYRVQVMSVPHNGGYFRIAADPQPGRDGYFADVDDLLDASSHPSGAAAQVEVMINPESHMDAAAMEEHDYNPGTDWKVYGVQIFGGRAVFLLNDFRQSQIVSTQTDTLSNGPIHFVSGGVVLRISSISIVTV